MRPIVTTNIPYDDILRERIPARERAFRWFMYICPLTSKEHIVKKYSEGFYEHIMNELSSKHNDISDYNTDTLLVEDVPMSKEPKYKLYSHFDDAYRDFKRFGMFDKQKRSTFKYWFAHWCAFNMTALNLGIWKFKYLFHDFEKPWLMKLWRGDYKRVQKYHRTHNKHHLEWGLEHGFENMDWNATIVDWECCMFSKQEAQLDARETLEYEVSGKWKEHEEEIRKYAEPVLKKLGL